MSNKEASSSRNSATRLINGDFDVIKIKDYQLLSVIPYEIVGSDDSKINQLN